MGLAAITLPEAVLIGGGVAAAGGVASSVIGSNAASSAANTQAAAANKALAQQQATTSEVLGIEQPFVNVGTNAIPAYNQLLGLDSSGNFSPTNMSSALAQTPGYQFALTQGEQQAQSGFASQGLAKSGPAIKGAVNYAEGLAGTQYQNILSNYYNTLSLGSNAAANFGASALGGQAAANQLITGAGQATASGIIGSANAVTGGIGTTTSNLGSSALLLGLNNQGLFGPSGGTVFGTGGPSVGADYNLSTIP